MMVITNLMAILIKNSNDNVGNDDDALINIFAFDPAAPQRGREEQEEKRKE